MRYTRCHNSPRKAKRHDNMTTTTPTVTTMDYDDAKELNMLVSADILRASDIFEYASAGFNVQQIFDEAAEVAFSDHHAPGDNRHIRFCRISEARNRRIYRARQSVSHPAFQD